MQRCYCARHLKYSQRKVLLDFQYVLTIERVFFKMKPLWNIQAKETNKGSLSNGSARWVRIFHSPSLYFFERKRFFNGNSSKKKTLFCPAPIFPTLGRGPLKVVFNLTLVEPLVQRALKWTFSEHFLIQRQRSKTKFSAQDFKIMLLFGVGRILWSTWMYQELRNTDSFTKSFNRLEYFLMIMTISHENEDF